MDDKPFLSVIIPAHREAERITATLHAIERFLERQPWRSEIIVVDDGSTDATVTVVERCAEQYPGTITVLRHGKNRGKGAAVRTGMQRAHGTLALFADADNATPIEELPKLLRAVEEGADIVIASRYLPGSDVVYKQSLLRRFMSRAGWLLFRLLLGLRFSDTRCGFKLFSERARELVFARQTLERWGFDTEILVIAQRRGLRVREVPVQWFDRKRGNIHPLRDSLRSVREIFHIRRLVRTGAYD